MFALLQTSPEIESQISSWLIVYDILLNNINSIHLPEKVNYSSKR